jgi:hypothetical protein
MAVDNLSRGNDVRKAWTKKIRGLGHPADKKYGLL